MGDMDSGNSGSLQSSSGGEEEYDSSRGGATAADSFSAFFNHQQQLYQPAEGHHHVTLGSYPNPPPPPPPPSSFFDPLSTYFDNLSRSTNPNPVLNPDPVWTKETNTIIRSDPILIPSTSGPGLDHHLPPSSSTTDKQISGGGARNPRKRTRASRRAPTTVLTTDTTNFRAMVQEFTGIPAPPFGSSAGSSNSLLFPRTRFDLFGNIRGGGAMDAPAPPYLLRPLAQKVQIPTNKNDNNSTDVMAASSSSGGNYHMDLGLLNLPFKYPVSDPIPGSDTKPAPGGSLELPVTIRNNNNNNDDGGVQLGGPLGWAEGLGLGADAGAGAGAGGASASRAGNMSAQHSHQRPQNLGFAHQQIG